VTIVQTAVGNLIATGVGAAAYVTLLRGRYRMRLVSGIGSLVLARFGDLVVLTVMLAVAMAWLWPALGRLQIVMLLLLLILAASIGMVGLLILVRERFVQLILTACHMLRIERVVLVRKLHGAFNELLALDKHTLCELAGSLLQYSLWLNALSIVFLFCVARAFDFPLDLAGITLAVACTQLFSLVPVHVMGGLGTFDLTMLYLFEQLGISASSSSVFLVSYRLTFYLFNLLMLGYVPFANLLERSNSAERTI
jgi:hypothetical protein